MAVIGKPLVTLLLAVSLGVAAAGDASAQSSKFSYVSKPGDPVGKGTSRVIKDDVNAGLENLTGGEGVSMEAYASGTYYTLRVRAPKGKKLVPGVYTGGVGYWADPSKPGISFRMGENECTSSVGAFEVLDAKLGPVNYIERLHLRFKHACKGAPAGSYGELVIKNPPPPPLMTSKVIWDKRAVLAPGGGWIAISGTYTCSKENGDLAIAARIKQKTASGKTLYGRSEERETYLRTCDGTPRRIELLIEPENCRSFVAGKARLTYDSIMEDPDFGGTYNVTKSIDVNVVRSY